MLLAFIQKNQQLLSTRHCNVGTTEAPMANPAGNPTEAGYSAVAMVEEPSQSSAGEVKGRARAPTIAASDPSPKFHKARQQSSSSSTDMFDWISTRGKQLVEVARSLSPRSSRPPEAEEGLCATAAPSVFFVCITVIDFEKICHFYGEILQLKKGRGCPASWQDYCLGGHQLRIKAGSHAAPAHIGLIVSANEFERVVQMLHQAGSDAGVINDPDSRSEEEEHVGEAIALKDPAGNTVEFRKSKGEGFY